MINKNRLAFLLCAATGFLAACHEQPAANEQAKASTPPASAASVAPKPPASASSAASNLSSDMSFMVGVLESNDGKAELQDCSTSLTRTDPGSQSGDIFRETNADKDNVGFIRIDGRLVRVNLVQTNTDDTSTVTVFEDASHTVRIVETIPTGEADENADSAATHGSLTITVKGSTQTLHVDSRLAC